MSAFSEALIQRYAVALTQGGADAAVAVEIDTGISTAAAFGWWIERVQLFMPANFETATNPADLNVRMQAHKGPSQGAFLAATDNDVLCELGFYAPHAAAATSGLYVPAVLEWQAPTNYVVVNPTITLRLDTVGSGLTSTFYAAIFYSPVKIAELDLLRMLAS